LASEQLANGNYTQRVSTTSKDEVGQLANSFNDMASQLDGLIGSLEQRVAERTRNLELAAEVGRTVSQVRALDVMLNDAAELIRQQFDLYYVQVYLADASQTNLILQSGTGSVGEQLISLRHHLPLNTNSINGRAAVEKKSVVISDTTASAAFKPNPLLPHTRSEMSVPLLIGDKVVGVLDMQSEHPDSLNQEVLSAFEALAGQLAIAIQNANLLAEAEQARAEVEAQARRLTRANWTEYLDAVHKPEETGFVFEHNKIAPLTQEQAEGENATAAPITVTGETLGKLVVEMEGGSPIARTDELVNAVARQVAQHIENLRLLDSAERYRAEAEQASRRLTHEGWQDYMFDSAAKGLGYIYDLNEVRPFKQDEEKQVEEAGISLPLKVRDETVGRIIVKGVEGDEASDLVNAVAERLGAHIEGLRLSLQTEQALASTKKQAQREQALRQITSAVRGSTDPTVILRTAARELGNILGRQTVVKLATASESKTGQADHPAEIAGETVGNESVSSADRS
jgi:GAF domain-containing protein